MKRITLKFKELYDIFATDKIDNEIVSTKKRIFVKKPNGELTEVRGLIKKTNQLIHRVELVNGITHNCADKHLLKTSDNSFKFSKDLTNDDNLLFFNSNPEAVRSSIYVKTGDAYDISIDHPHEYITPNGLIHHNTTVARILISNIVKSSMDVLELNGSASTGVDVVRDDITGFLKVPPVSSRLKIVFIDEFDYMSPNAQSALRNIIEKYSDNGRFICTANYFSKIIDPLHSRFQSYEMKTIKIEFAVDFCSKILEKEKISYDLDTVKMIVKNFMPDMRKAVNTIQRNVCNGVLPKIDPNSIITDENKLVALLMQICDDIGTPRQMATCNNNVPKIFEIINTEPDYMSLYRLLGYNEKLPLWGKIKVNEYSNRHQGCAIPSHHFMAMIYEIIESGMKYFKIFGGQK